MKMIRLSTTAPTSKQLVSLFHCNHHPSNRNKSYSVKTLIVTGAVPPIGNSPNELLAYVAWLKATPLQA